MADKTKFRYNCSMHKDKITDKFLLRMPNLESLNLWCEECNDYCSKFPITDLSISRLIHLTDLDCSNSQEVSDLSINLLVNLKRLTCYNCPLITKNAKYRISNYDNIKNLFPKVIMEIVWLYSGDCEIINPLLAHYPNLLKQIRLLQNDNCTSFICRIHNKKPSKLLREYIDNRKDYVNNIK